MNVAVFGLGYVGSTTAACLASLGHTVVGVDVNDAKVDALLQGKAPVLEPGLDDLIAAAVGDGTLTATTDAAQAVRASDVLLICVGTPSNKRGGLSTEALERVVATIGAELVGVPQRCTVVVRSTVLPGTTDGVVIPLLEEHSGRRAGSDFGVAVNPEFLREGSSIADFRDPARTVIGELDPASGDAVAHLYEPLPAPTHRVSIGTAEMIKYADNSFHALKIAFANEIGAFSSAAGVDSREVMALVKSDTKLNISPSYLSPGFSFGGSCLPKDLRALLDAANRVGVELPLLGAVLASNERHVSRAVEIVQEIGNRRIGLFGLAFKAGTDDLRESPLVELAERLVGKGFDVRIYDPDVTPGTLVGTNLSYVEAHLPHLSRLLLPTAEETSAHAETIIVGNARPETITALRSRPPGPIVDLAGLPRELVDRVEGMYFSVTW